MHGFKNITSVKIPLSILPIILWLRNHFIEVGQKAKPFEMLHHIVSPSIIVPSFKCNYNWMDCDSHDGLLNFSHTKNKSSDSIQKTPTNYLDAKNNKLDLILLHANAKS